MKKKTIICLTISILILAITLVLASCAPAKQPVFTPAPEAKVTGTVAYLEKMALPAGAIVEVKLLDISRQDAPAVTIGEHVITTSGNQVPFPFEIKYNPTSIDPRYTYSVRASITVDGKLWFTTDTRYAVITQGNPSSVEIVLKKVTTSIPVATLENTTWVLQSYGQPGNLKSVLKDTEVTALFDSAKGRVVGSAGVNTYFGGYKLDDNKLIIPEPIGSTKMAGPQPLMDQETEFFKLLQTAESHQIEDSQLRINSGQQVLIFAKKIIISTPVATLENTTWVLQSYGQTGNLKSVLKDTVVTVLFDSAKGQVAGSAGVNRYVGGYKLDGNKLIIPGPFAVTAMAGPQPLMDQEKEYLTALQAAESYKIEGDKLTITCGSKALLFTKK